MVITRFSAERNKRRKNEREKEGRREKAKTIGVFPTTNKVTYTTSHLLSKLSSQTRTLLVSLVICSLMQQCSCLFNYGNHPFRISSRETTCKTRPFSFLHTWNDNKVLQSTASSKSSTATPPTVNLAYTDYYTPEDPESAGTPVLFLHGLLGSKRNFETLAARLGARLDTPRRIIGLDLRNHGASAETPIASMTYFEMAKDVLAFLDSQNLSKVILVGHSMGGKVSQTLALLTGTQRVEGLVVLDIAPVPYSSSEPHWKMVEEVLWACARADGTDKQTIDHQLKEVVPDPNLRAFCMTNFGKDSWKIPLDYIVDQLDNLAGFEVEGSSKYDGDVFIIHGGQSKFVRASHMEKISNFFPNHMLTTIRGAGHWVHAEAPDDTIALLKRYLDR